uniref:Uncharacterized protein n=1 Tax=Salix viminalis TaxID=40686 RepID=A0A6N2N0G6_SALVM
MLGVTNGYLTSVLMILTPKSVSVSEAEFSAIAMVVFLGIGLVGGSVIGWLAGNSLYSQVKLKNTANWRRLDYSPYPFQSTCLTLQISPFALKRPM